MKKLFSLLLTAAISLSALSGLTVHAEEADPFAGKSTINIVYLGGSITQGAGVSDKTKTWVSRISNYFKGKYADKTVNNYNVGIGGTGSDMGIMRLERDVLSKNPDYVFVEFAVNDIGKASAVRNMESIVQSLNSLKNVPYVTFVYTAKYNSSKHALENNSAAHQTVADYYGIPVVDMKPALEDAILSTGTMEDTDNVKHWLVDLTHPTEYGYDVYTRCIENALESGSYYVRPQTKTEKLDINSYPMSTKWVSADSAIADGTWTKNNHASYGVGYSSMNAGDTLEYTFSGTVFGLQHRISKTGGMYNLAIDGKSVGDINTYYRGITTQGVLGYQNFNLGAGEHRVKITVLDSADERVEKGAQTSVAFDYFVSEKAPASAKLINENYDTCDFKNIVKYGNMTYDWSTDETADNSKGAMFVSVKSASSGPNYRIETKKGTSYNISAMIKIKNIADWQINSNSDKVRFVFQSKRLNEDGSWDQTEAYNEVVVTDAGIISGDWVKVTGQYICDGKGKLAGQSARVDVADISRMEIRIGSGNPAATTGVTGLPVEYYVDDLKVAPETTASISDSDFAVYSFENGEKLGKNATENDNAEIVFDGLLGGKYALKVTNSSSSAAGWKLPVNWKNNVKYNVSFYFKPLDDAQVSFRPLLYGADKQYTFTENASSPATLETMTRVGNGWYFYSKEYDNTKLEGLGTIELRWTSPAATSYILDDVVIAPVTSDGGALIDEDFEGVEVGKTTSNNTTFLGQIKNYEKGTVTILNDADNASIGNYIQMDGSELGTRNTGIATDKILNIKKDSQYELSFDAKAVNDKAVGAKIMWHLSNANYIINDDNLPRLSKEWQHTVARFDMSKVTADLSAQNLRTMLGNSQAAGGIFAFDNIKLAEINDTYPKVTSVDVSKAPVLNTELTAAINGTANKYLYTVSSMNDDTFGIIAESGVTETGVISYTPSEDTVGKVLKISVTALDDSAAYNTISVLTEPVKASDADYKTGAAASFVNAEWSTRLSGKAELTAGKDGASFTIVLAVYDEDGMLITNTLNQKALRANTAETIEIPIAVSRSAYSAKLFVWDALSQKPYCKAASISAQ